MLQFESQSPYCLFCYWNMINFSPLWSGAWMSLLLVGLLSTITRHLCSLLLLINMCPFHSHSKNCTHCSRYRLNISLHSVQGQFSPVCSRPLQLCLPFSFPLHCSPIRITSFRRHISPATQGIKLGKKQFCHCQDINLGLSVLIQ